jgi:hypothetical protein
MVFAELAKKQLNSGQRLSMYFWRTHGGQEVDFIIEHGLDVQAIEVKSGMTVQTGMFRSLKNAMVLWRENKIQGWLFTVETGEMICMEMSSCLGKKLIPCKYEKDRK